MYSTREVFRQYLSSSYRSTMSFQRYLAMLAWWKK